MTRRDWNEVAAALYKVSQRNGMHTPTLDAAIDAVAEALDDRSARFDVERFSRTAGRSTPSDDVRWGAWVDAWKAIAKAHVRITTRRVA